MAERPVNSSSSAALAGERAVVTGSSSGIGRAIAVALARAGADLLVHARSSDEALRETVELCRAEGVRAESCLIDLSEPSGCAELIRHAFDVFGPVHHVFNNAGADVLTGQAAELSFEDKLDLLWRVDVRATVTIARAAGEHMREQRSSLGRAGLIVNMGWDQAERGMEADSGELFAATKGAVMAFSRSLALSLAPHVRVNCLAPGWIKTAWGKDDASPEWHARVLRETPAGRWGRPEDVAAAALYLASPGAEFITGQVLRVNGGAVR